MRFSTPSPSLVISTISLVVACGGTATAAGVIKISSSKQVKNSVLTGAKIKNKSLTGSDLADSTISSRNMKKGSVTPDALSAAAKSSMGSGVAGGGISAVEAVRKAGPDNQAPNTPHTIATAAQLAPGTYALIAKTTLTPTITNAGLGELLRQNKTVSAECLLQSGGDQDNARTPIASPYSTTPSTLNLQTTRTFSAPTDVTLSCNTNDYGWSATDTSIIAIKLAGSTRTDVAN